MVRFEDLGFSSLEEYLKYFTKTLLPTNKTFYYFVDWHRIKKNVEKYSPEIHILNSLRNSKKDKIRDDFITLAKKYPEIIKILPLLIAVRLKEGKLEVFDDLTNKFIELDFGKNTYSESELKEIALFCDKTGIFSLILNVKDLYDYIIGVEVGLDSNARKNRSGKIFEVMVKKLLENIIPKNNKIKVVYQDKETSLYRTGSKKINTHDFVIYYKNRPLFVIEVNFYNTQGSKPDSIVGNYINMNNEAKKRGIGFVWITDGPAWKKMQPYLKKAMSEIDWVLNFNITKNYFKKILKSHIGAVYDK